jgi:hypothetical protein
MRYNTLENAGAGAPQDPPDPRGPNRGTSRTSYEEPEDEDEDEEEVSPRTRRPLPYRWAQAAHAEILRTPLDPSDAHTRTYARTTSSFELQTAATSGSYLLRQGNQDCSGNAPPAAAPLEDSRFPDYLGYATDLSELMTRRIQHTAMRHPYPPNNIAVDFTDPWSSRETRPLRNRGQRRPARWLRTELSASQSSRNRVSSASNVRRPNSNAYVPQQRASSITNAIQQRGSSNATAQHSSNTNVWPQSDSSNTRQEHAWQENARQGRDPSVNALGSRLRRLSLSLDLAERITRSCTNGLTLPPSMAGFSDLVRNPPDHSPALMWFHAPVHGPDQSSASPVEGSTSRTNGHRLYSSLGGFLDLPPQHSHHTSASMNTHCPEQQSDNNTSLKQGTTSETEDIARQSRGSDQYCF